MSDLVKLTIEGREVEVPRGTSVLEAAKLAGVLIPHYCYHPSLPVAGVCRMCLVEIEKQPKLAASCATPVAEGMVVSVGSEQAQQARRGVLEFLLINHPLDCPICDQAGECELQDYVFQEGRSGTRFSEYAKRFSPVETFGDDVLYVPNRCILCTRCVRFMEHVAEEPVLNVSERGDRAYIGINPEQPLNHPWAGNVVDLCPVGSLISKDFLHKARAWDLDKTPSICTGCTQGCNVTLETRDNAVLRVRPRPNEAINRHFICDEGRLGYAWMNRADRLEVPLVRQAGKLVATDWEHALDAAARLVREHRGGVALASARASNESLAALAALVVGSGGSGAFRVREGEEAPLAGVPGLALRKERAPNLTGALAAGFGRDWAAATARIGGGLTMVLDAELEGVKLSGPALVITTVLDEASREGADVVLPCCNTSEEEGSLTNRDGIVQRYWQARQAPGMARPAAWILEEIAARTGARVGATA
jgi:NADH-quinone oxidoreductase subunit G